MISDTKRELDEGEDDDDGDNDEAMETADDGKNESGINIVRISR